MWILYVIARKILKRQKHILAIQQTILERITQMGQILDEVKAFAAKIDEATNAVAARIQTLIDKLAAGTLTSEELATALQPEVDKLQAMAQDPANPV